MQLILNFPFTPHAVSLISPTLLKRPRRVRSIPLLTQRTSEYEQYSHTLTIMTHWDRNKGKYLKQLSSSWKWVLFYTFVDRKLDMSKNCVISSFISFFFFFLQHCMQCCAACILCLCFSVTSHLWTWKCMLSSWLSVVAIVVLCRLLLKKVSNSNS